MPSITVNQDWVKLPEQNITFQQTTLSECVIRLQETPPDPLDTEGFVLTRYAINRFEYKGVPIYIRARETQARIYYQEGDL